MRTIKISQLPQTYNLNSNTQNSIFTIVDLSTDTTYQINASDVANTLYLNSNLNTQEIYSNNLFTNNITSDVISSNTILNANDLTTGNIFSNTINTSTITANTISLTNDVTTRGNITANSLSSNSTISASLGWAGTNSNAMLLGGIPFVYTCECNGSGNIGDILSFGAGSKKSKGITMPFNGKLHYATLSGTNVIGNISTQLYYNGIANSSFQLSQINGTLSNVYQYLDMRSNPFTFNAGDTLGWYINSAPASANCFQVCFFVSYN